MRQYTLVCEEEVAHRVESLASEYEISESEVLKQLVESGLEQIE